MAQNSFNLNGEVANAISNSNILIASDTAIVSLEELSKAIEDQIRSLQTMGNKDKDIQTIKKQINLLNDSFKHIDKELKLNSRLELYKQIISISLSIRRKLISTLNLSNIDPYVNINYAFYYEGRRYYVDELKVEWLEETAMAGSTSQGLYISLDKVVEEIKKAEQQDINATVRDKLKEHYDKFATTITKSKSFQSSHINFGHISEGFERHIQEHHRSLYNSLNEVNYDENVVKLIEELKWPDETESEVWEHINSSLGHQVGTSAGDVLNIQVKSQKYANSPYNLRLSSIQNLKKGFDLYSQMITIKDPKKIKKLSQKIAKYLTQTLQNNTKNKFKQLKEAITNKFREF